MSETVAALQESPAVLAVGDGRPVPDNLGEGDQGTGRPSTPRYPPHPSASDPQPPMTWTEWAVLSDSTDAVFMKSSVEADVRHHFDRWIEHGEPVRLARREVTRRVVIDATPFEVIQ